MSELIDPRPVFTIVMGCNGVGKSTWKRKNYDLLPDRYYDQDSIAGGLGEWSDERARTRTREIVDSEIAECLREELDFGIESAFSGLPGPEMVRRVVEAGYRVEGLYFGTADSRINIERIEHRVFCGTGHPVDPRRNPDAVEALTLEPAADRRALRPAAGLRQLQPDDFGLPRPVEQCRLERGAVVWRAEKPLRWCANWLEALADRQAELRRRSAKATRRAAFARRERGSGSVSD